MSTSIFTPEQINVLNKRYEDADYSMYLSKVELTRLVEKWNQQEQDKWLASRQAYRDGKIKEHEKYSRKQIKGSSMAIMTFLLESNIRHLNQGRKFTFTWSYFDKIVKFDSEGKQVKNIVKKLTNAGFLLGWEREFRHEKKFVLNPNILVKEVSPTEVLEERANSIVDNMIAFIGAEEKVDAIPEHIQALIDKQHEETIEFVHEPIIKEDIQEEENSEASVDVLIDIMNQAMPEDNGFGSHYSNKQKKESKPFGENFEWIVDNHKKEQERQLQADKKERDKKVDKHCKVFSNLKKNTKNSSVNKIGDIVNNTMKVLPNPKQSSEKRNQNSTFFTPNSENFSNNREFIKGDKNYKSYKNPHFSTSGNVENDTGKEIPTKETTTSNIEGQGQEFGTNRSQLSDLEEKKCSSNRNSENFIHKEFLKNQNKTSKGKDTT